MDPSKYIPITFRLHSWGSPCWCPQSIPCVQSQGRDTGPDIRGAIFKPTMPIICMHPAPMHVCIYVRMYACMHVCMYACMYVCMYVILGKLCMDHGRQYPNTWGLCCGEVREGDLLLSAWLGWYEPRSTLCL